MPKLVIISGSDLIKSLKSKGFVFLRQKGSHVRLGLEREKSSFNVTVPEHDEIDRGTLKNIIRALEKCLTKEEIKEIFYK